MANIYKNITELIGRTPLLQIQNIEQEKQFYAHIFVKLEYFNPAGSVKDRIAKNMIEDAEMKGLIQKGAAIIEATSGNTGIGLASVASAKGYRAIFTMPETMSMERQKILKAYGAEIVLTNGKTGMTGAIDKAKELAEEIPGSMLLGQFVNPSNPQTHYLTTGPEIWNDMDGKVDILVAGVGTGGTITGTGRYLREQKKDIRIVGIEPSDSAVLSGGKAAPHKIQGLGAGFVPEVLVQDLIDEMVCVKTKEAYETTRFLAQKEGVLAGISSGAALYAAFQEAKKEEHAGKNIVVILPDTGERYLSTDLFEKI